MIAPNIGGMSKMRASTNRVTPMPTAYCPHATICPNASCGPAMRQTFLSGGMATPRNSVANTMLMRKLGSLLQPAVASETNDSEPGA
jgi:hypothetical protein